MPNKIFTELQAYTREELVRRLERTRLELFQAKMNHATGQLKQKSHLSRLRKEIARILTLQTARKVSA